MTGNIFKGLDLTLTLRSNCVCKLKKPYVIVVVGPRSIEYEETCRQIWTVNLLEGSYCPLTTASRLNGVYVQKCLIFSLLLVLIGMLKHYRKSWAMNNFKGSYLS